MHEDLYIFAAVMVYIHVYTKRRPIYTYTNSRTST